MKSIQRFRKALQSLVMTDVILAIILGTALTAAAQDFSDLETPKSPLALKALGSFYVGGQTVTQAPADTGSPSFVPGTVVNNQMYVRFMVPEPNLKVPVVMVHGGLLSGKEYETTPDGRMGWDEYFLRNGHAVYIPDQVGVARSGFNTGIVNNVRAGGTSSSTSPPWLRLSMEDAWVRFRFGQTAAAPFPGTQFPVAAAKEWAKQITPMTSFPVIPNPNPTVMALSDLSSKLKGAVILGHSQSGFYGFNALLAGATDIRGLVNVEPGAPPASDCSDYKDEQIPTLAKVPILFVFADHLDAPAVTARLAGFNSCKALVTRINAANGKAQMLSLPELGIFGNSHMLMQDKNNRAVADLILKWIALNVDKR